MKTLLTALLLMGASQLVSLDSPNPKGKQYVVYAADQQTVVAGKPSRLELRFQVVEGFHINSHTPNSELLIPTQMVLDPAAGVTPRPAEYPKGQPYSFSFDPSNRLDVYAGDFVVKLPVTAQAGSHELHGSLKYQACDHAACYPPKTLPLTVVFTAR